MCDVEDGCVSVCVCLCFVFILFRFSRVVQKFICCIPQFYMKCLIAEHVIVDCIFDGVRVPVDTEVCQRERARQSERETFVNGNFHFFSFHLRVCECVVQEKRKKLIYLNRFARRDENTNKQTNQRVSYSLNWMLSLKFTFFFVRSFVLLVTIRIRTIFFIAFALYTMELHYCAHIRNTPRQTVDAQAHSLNLLLHQ